MTGFLLQVDDVTYGARQEQNKLFQAMISPKKPSQGVEEEADNPEETYVSEASQGESCGYSRVGFHLQCNSCNHKTDRKSSMKRHIRKHTGVKPYYCDICGYQAARKDTLSRHLRTHTGVKPYHCDICGYQAARKYSLVKHLRTHTGVKPYHYEVCGYKAARKHNLDKHLRSHTGVKLSSQCL